MRAFYAGLALGAALAGGCSETTILPPGTEQDLIIGAVVREADSVFVSIGQSGVGRPNRPLDAELVLHRATGDVALDRLPQESCRGPDDFACYAARLLSPVSSGETIALSGTLEDGGLMSGSTVVPTTPAVTIRGAGAGDTIHVGSLAVGPPILDVGQGEGVLMIAGEMGLDVIVWAGTVERQCSTGFGLTHMDLRPRDNEAARAVELSLTPFAICDGPLEREWDSLAVTIPVMSYDENLSGWIRSGEFLPRPSRYGVDGIHGVFGSASSRTFVLIAVP